MTPAVSVLLPTRGRPEHCRRSVRCLRELAARPGDVEVLLRHDDDDPPPPFSSAEVGALGALRVFGGPRHGYGGMHRYYNQLAAEARGEWLLLWNDDADMLTPGWDDLLRDAPPFCVQNPRRDVTPTTDFTFPALGRPVYEALGRVATNGFCDAWLSDVTCYAAVAVLRDDVTFLHHRIDDDTMRGQHLEGPAEWARFNGDAERASRRAAVEAVLAAPGWARRFEGWRAEERDLGGARGFSGGPRTARSFVLRGRDR